MQFESYWGSSCKSFEDWANLVRRNSLRGLTISVRVNSVYGYWKVQQVGVRVSGTDFSKFESVIHGYEQWRQACDVLKDTAACSNVELVVAMGSSTNSKGRPVVNCRCCPDNRDMCPSVSKMDKQWPDFRFKVGERRLYLYSLCYQRTVDLLLQTVVEAIQPVIYSVLMNCCEQERWPKCTKGGTLCIKMDAGFISSLDSLLT